MLQRVNNRWVRGGGYCAVAYVGFVSMLVFFENRLVYQPTSAAWNWVPPPTTDIQDVELTTADGTRIHAWWCPKPGSDGALLYCHGNAGNLSHRGPSIVKLRDELGVSVLIIDYPGYGKSAGSPSEAGCYQAADAAYVWLTKTKNIAPKKVVLYGVSLGGGVITELASQNEHRALVLVSTFTSLPDVASELYWWLPAPKRMLMTNQFDSIGRLKSCCRPIFIAHGTRDELIPHTHGERLFAAVEGPKRFYSMPDLDHNSPLPRDFYAALRRFLEEHPVE